MLTVNQSAMLARAALSHTISFHTFAAPARAVPFIKIAGRACTLSPRPQYPQSCTIRSFSVAKAMPFEFFSSRQSQDAKKDAQSQSPVILSEPAWPHPVYTERQMNDIVCPVLTGIR